MNDRPEKVKVALTAESLPALVTAARALSQAFPRVCMAPPEQDNHGHYYTTGMAEVTPETEVSEPAEQGDST